MTPSLGLTDLLEQLSELRKPVYALEYGLLRRIIKGMHEQPDEEIR